MPHNIRYIEIAFAGILRDTRSQHSGGHALTAKGCRQVCEGVVCPTSTHYIGYWTRKGCTGSLFAFEGFVSEDRQIIANEDFQLYSLLCVL